MFVTGAVAPTALGFYNDAFAIRWYMPVGAQAGAGRGFSPPPPTARLSFSSRTASPLSWEGKRMGKTGKHIAVEQQQQR